MKIHKILIPLITAFSLILIQGCAVDDRALEGSKDKSPQLAVNDEVITPDPEDEIIDYNEETFSETVTLSFKLGSGSNNSGRSIARTAIGTFEEITSLYVNAIRQGKESLIYTEPGQLLTKLSNTSWTGTLNGFIVNENYTIRISAMNDLGVLIFTGETNHTIQGAGSNNSINITLNPVLNNTEISVPVISSVNLKETVGKGNQTTINTIVNNIDNGTLRWRYEAYQIDSSGFANMCPQQTCGSFSPSDNTSRFGVDNVSYSQGKYIHQIKSTYTAPDNVSEQNLRVIVSNHSGIGVETRFKIKVTGPVDSNINVNVAPSILSITAFRVQDNNSCPEFDCLALEALVDDDRPFSELTATWSFNHSGNKSFSDNSSQLVSSFHDNGSIDLTKGKIRTILRGYNDYDDFEITLKLVDGENLQGSLVYPLTPNSYPIIPVCDLSGNECVAPQFNKDILLLTDNSTWVSSDGGLSWDERGRIKDLNLPSYTLVQGNPINEFSYIVSGSITSSQRKLTYHNSNGIAYGNGRYISVGSTNISSIWNGIGQQNDNGSIRSFNYDNQSMSEWGYRLITSTDNGHSWQTIDNVTFSNPRSIISNY